MGSFQSTILAAGQPYGYAGQLTTPNFYDSQSAVNKEASASMAFGCGVKPGVYVKEALLPTANSSKLAGVLINNQTYAPGTFGNVSATGITPNTFGELLTTGRMYVAVSPDTVGGVDVPAYWCFQTAGNDTIGQFRDTDSGNVVDTTKQVMFKGVPIKDVTQLTGATQYICEVFVNVNNKP